MPGHVIHVAMQVLGQPAEQMMFIFRQVYCGDAALLKAQLMRPVMNVIGQRPVVRERTGGQWFICLRHARIITRMTPLPHELYRAADVRELDRIAIEQQAIEGMTLMTRAGQAVFEQLRLRWPQARKLIVVAGRGNNAGDGFIVSRLAHVAGMSVKLMLLAEQAQLTGDAAQAFQDMARAGVECIGFDPAGFDEADVIVDALLGTGLVRDVTGRYRDAVTAMNEARSPVLAVDIPSGLDADNGCIHGVAVQADVTITLIGLKPGLLTGEGPAYSGVVVFDSLQVPAAVYAQRPAAARRVDYESEQSLLQPRPATLHKGDCGHVLVIGGDIGMAGAPRMAAEAAARVGAGLVSIATTPDHAAALAASRPELMAHGITSAAQLAALIDRADVVAVGPGLGQRTWGSQLLAAVLDCDRPLIVDADALNLLASDPVHRDNWILTPHPGEAARLLGMPTSAVQQDRFAAASAIQQRFGGLCVLKGAGTVICDTGSRFYLCNDGNPGMASGGMGDVLTGIIAGLLAQFSDQAAVACLAVALHARAGDIAAGDMPRGMLASDLLMEIRPLANPV